MSRPVSVESLAVRAAILRYLATVRDASTAQICGATKIDSIAVRAACAGLVGLTQIAREGVSPRHRFAITDAGRATLGPARATGRRLPTLSGKMLAGGGERRDGCARYLECLASFTKSQIGAATDRYAHCPIACSSYAPAVAAGAAEYARSGRSSQEAAIFAGWP